MQKPQDRIHRIVRGRFKYCAVVELIRARENGGIWEIYEEAFCAVNIRGELILRSGNIRYLHIYAELKSIVWDFSLCSLLWLFLLYFLFL